jgi:F420-dependent oxidoreductase-like protein
MKLRVFVEPQQGASYDQLLRFARAAEDLEFDAFFRSDHYLRMGAGSPWPGPTDSWVTLAGLARETSRIRLGTMVTSATFRLPGPLAISVAQVDQMSGGRVELGIGAGWYEGEHAAYGMPFPSVVERFERLEEQVAIIHGLWTTPVDETFSFAGTHYPVLDSPALPKPVQSPPPLILGGAGKKRAAALAAGLAETSAIFERIRSAVAEVGRAPDSMTYSTALVVCVGTDEAMLARRAKAIGREPAELRENGLGGSPSEVVDKIGRYAEIGAGTVYLQCLDVDDVDHLELIAGQVGSQL